MWKLSRYPPMETFNYPFHRIFEANVSGVFSRLFSTVRKFKYWFTRISCFVSLFFRWFNFEMVVEDLVGKNVYHINVEQLQTYAKEVCFIEDEDQFYAMLNFYHDLGMIVKHRSTVILKTQWLIELFKMLITIPPFEKAVWNRNAWYLKPYLCMKLLAHCLNPWSYIYFYWLWTALKWNLFFFVKARALAVLTAKVAFCQRLNQYTFIKSRSFKVVRCDFAEKF